MSNNILTKKTLRGHKEIKILSYYNPLTRQQSLIINLLVNYYIMNLLLIKCTSHYILLVLST